MSRKTSVFKVSAAQAVSGTAQSGVAPTEGYDEAVVYIKPSAAGTTVTPVIEVSPDEGTTWFTHTTMSAITSTAGVKTAVLTGIGKLMRINYTAVTGSFTIDAWIEGKSYAS